MAIIAVNYGTDAQTWRLVRELGQATPEQYRLIIVDNTERAESNEFFSGLRVADPHILCAKAPRNLGYYPGADFGLQRFLATGADFDWVVVANVDTHFVDGSFVARLGELERREDVGVVAPSVWSSFSNKDLNPYLLTRPTDRRMRIYRLLFSSAYGVNCYGYLSALRELVRQTLRRVVSRLRNGRPDQVHVEPSVPERPAGDGVRMIYAPHGSCVMFAKSFFARGGSLDYPSFLYGEEFYVAETARKLGLHVLYDPSIRVTHDEHASTGTFPSLKMAGYVRDSTRFVVDNYFSN